MVRVGKWLVNSLVGWMLDVVGAVLCFVPYFRQRKAAKQVLGAAATFVWSYEDLPEWQAREDFARLRAAVCLKDVPEAKRLLEVLQPKLSCAIGREWLDILVVAVSVAMAFRAYFYEPFNIPTGSMQPTLYGNHSQTMAATQATMWDSGALKWLKWAWTGEEFKRLVAPCNGRLAFRNRNDGYIDVAVTSALGIEVVGKLPSDVLKSLEDQGGPQAQQMPQLANGLRPGDQVRAGQEIWCGKVVTGDFLFVNRWIWNFRKPRRGDVMVFATTGIAGLQQGTHYIKRMVGTPNQTIAIRQGQLLIDGKAVSTPERIDQITRRVKFAPFAYPYAGWRVSNEPRFDSPGRTLVRESDEVKLGADEYYACGDNSPNSFDSRYWGPVPGKNLCGLAGGVFWPFGSPRWGNIK